MHIVFVPALIRKRFTRSCTIQGGPILPRNTRLKWGSTLSDSGCKLSFRSLRRRRNVIHCRHGRPRSVRGQMNPEYRELKVSQRKRKGFFSSSQCGWFLGVSCTSPEQEWILLQADVGTNVEKTTDSEQAAAREEVERPSKQWRQQRMTAWTTEQRNQFDPGEYQRNHYIPS